MKPGSNDPTTLAPVAIVLMTSRVMGLITAVLDIAEEEGSVPEAAVYSAAARVGLSPAGFARLRATILSTGLVASRNDELVWTGPTPEPAYLADTKPSLN